MKKIPKTAVVSVTLGSVLCIIAPGCSRKQSPLQQSKESVPAGTDSSRGKSTAASDLRAILQDTGLRSGNIWSKLDKIYSGSSETDEDKIRKAQLALKDLDEAERFHLLQLLCSTFKDPLMALSLVDSFAGKKSKDQLIPSILHGADMAHLEALSNYTREIKDDKLRQECGAALLTKFDLLTSSRNALELAESLSLEEQDLAALHTTVSSALEQGVRDHHDPAEREKWLAAAQGVLAQLKPESASSLRKTVATEEVDLKDSSSVQSAGSKWNLGTADLMSALSWTGKLKGIAPEDAANWIAAVEADTQQPGNHNAWIGDIVESSVGDHEKIRKLLDGSPNSSTKIAEALGSQYSFNRTFDETMGLARTLGQAELTAFISGVDASRKLTGSVNEDQMKQLKELTH